MDSISAAPSVLPEERGLIFRTAFGTVPGVRKGTVEGTTSVRTKTCVKDSSSNLDDSFPFLFFLFMERIRCLLVSFSLQKKVNRHYLLSTNIKSWIYFHERPYFTFILYHILYYNIACELFAVSHSWQITPSLYLLLQKATNKALMSSRFLTANDDRSVHLLASSH